MIMRTTRNQRHKVHTKQTYSLKKLRTGKLVLALVGSFAVAVGAATIVTSVNAAEWTARTVEEIKQDIGDFSKPYTIKWGDTLSAIQEATGIDYHKIAADNGIEDVNLIYAGNILYNKNGYTAVANVQTGEVKVYQAQTPTPTANTQAAVSNAVAKTVVKDVTDSKDEKVQEIKQEIKQELQQSVKSNGQVTDKNNTQTVKPVETSNKLTEKPAETPSQPVEQPTVKPVETPSQPVEKPAVKPVETPSQPAEKPVETSKGTPEVQPDLHELVIEKGKPEVQPELPEATVETVVVNEEIPFKETIQDDPELYQGLTNRVPGAKGSEKVTYEVVKENGVEKSRTAINREMITPAKDAIVYRGTKPPVTAKGEPLVQPALEEYVAKEKGDPEVQPALPEATVETVTERVEKEIVEKVIEDDSIAQGKSVVESNGTKPRTEQDYTVVKVNNEVVSKEAKGEPREIDGTPKVVRKGTGHLLKYDDRTTYHKPVDGYTWESLNKMSDEEKSRITNDTEELRGIYLDDANAEEDMKIATQLLNLKKLNEEFAKLVNAERATQGRKLLVADENLIKLAKIRSDEQAGVGSLRSHGKKHTRPDGTRFASVFNTLENADMRYGTRGENALEHSSMVASAHAVLNATELARDMFIDWKNSPGHYRNMMSDQYTSFGLSASYTPHSTSAPEYYTGKSMIGITVFANDYDLRVQ